MTLDSIRELVNARRSIRYFSEKKVEKSTINELLEIAHLAPSVENTQPWEFHVVTSESIKKKLMEHSCYGNFLMGCCTFIVVTCRRRSVMSVAEPIWNPKELEYSCVAAMDNLILAATSIGLGTCWVSLHHGPVHNILHLKDGVTVIGGLMIGHLKEGEEIPSGEHQRRPVAESIVFHE